jgi:hypothetical protein
MLGIFKMNKIIPLYDRSRVVSDWSCPRKRYWNYEYEGKGIVKGNSSLELFTGTTIHDALAYIAKSAKLGEELDLDKLCEAAFHQMHAALISAGAGEVGAETFALEQATLVEGLIRGFYKHVWPRLMEQYPEILYVEQEMEFAHDGLLFMSKPDLVVGNKDQVVYVEYKSTSSKKDNWINSWDTAVQLHSTCKAVEATTGTRVDAVVVQGLYKGYESYGKQSSPFCYAYRRAGNPPFTHEEISYEYRAGFKRFPVWGLPGGIGAWVDKMPTATLADQFPQTPPIFINEELVEAFFRQRATREHNIAFFHRQDKRLDDPELVTDMTHESLLDMSFPQRFDQCSPGWGRGCEYKKLCHGAVRDPLSEGFTWRTPHHAKELEQDASE